MRSVRLTFVIVPILGGLLFAFQNCSLSTPGVDSNYSSVTFNHQANIQTCSNCHEMDRPAVDPTTQIVHGNGVDCVACHTPNNDPTVAFNTAWAGGQQPFTHSATGITSCVNCHSPNRPAAVNGFPHFNNEDCVECHNPNGNNTNGLTFSQITSAFFNSAGYVHPGTLTSCSQCHAPLRPAAPHDQTNDCINCHQTSDAWTQTTTPAQIQSLWEQNAQ